jgi:predicted nucleic acid-binding protein
MLIYLDTNVVLARYAPDEPQHDDAKILLNKIETGKLSAVTSVLTLIEVVCATSRAYERFDDEVGGLGREEVAGAFLRRVVSINKLRFIPMGGEVSVNVMERRVKLPALFVLALDIGSKTGVKTLDALHLASASVAARIYGYKIDCFVTIDEDILKRREDISSLIESRIVSPAEQL